MHSINLSVFVKPLCFQVWQCDLVKHHSKTFHGLLAHYGLNSHISLIAVKARSSFFKPFERLMLGELILNRSMTAYLSKISSFTLKNKNHLYKCNNGIINFCISSQVMFSSFKSTNVLHSFFHKTPPVNKGLCIWICYTQLQKYLRHCTVFWHKWPVHDLLLVMLHPLSKLLAIQDQAQNLEEQLWMGGRREVSVISHRPMTSSNLKQERSFFHGHASTFLQLVIWVLHTSKAMVHDYQTGWNMVHS